jgi:membrane-associated phospholipid phosphatase
MTRDPTQSALSTQHPALAPGYRRSAVWLGVAYAALVLAVAAGWLRPFDLSLARAAYFGLPCWTLNASQATSVLLAGELSLLYAGALALLCARRGRAGVGVWLVGLLLTTVAVELCFKHALDQPAPSAVLVGLERPDCGQISYPLTTVSTPSSLPSGYAIRAAYFGLLVAALVGARWPPLAVPARLTLGLALLLLGATRVIVGWHWPSDVLAGLLLGAAAASLGLALADGFAWLRPAAPGPR